MSETSVHILSTKKLTVEQLQLFDRKLNVTDTDFIQIHHNRLPTGLFREKISNAVFTSKNAVESLLINFLPEEIKMDNIYCVGRKTKGIIEKRLGKVTHYEKNAVQLANYLVKELKEESVTFFCGNQRRDELPVILTQHGIELKEVEVYRTLNRSKQMDGNFDAVLFFSPSAVKNFVEMNTFEQSVAYCIGETTAAEAKKYFEHVKVAEVPIIEQVIKLVNQDYVQNTKIT
ncbi:MAG: uroporphyrinogen-III synthase [Flavobacteriaceae bacterium]|nr:uroporphyrinogen-III synthase [Flavobacteriaceae bacterium]MCB0475705.1 uroporphyrinogen-III synthase [Flavobacteriaceae bacterium]